jgi:hypothetical protein
MLRKRAHSRDGGSFKMNTSGKTVEVGDILSESSLSVASTANSTADLIALEQESGPSAPVVPLGCKGVFVVCLMTSINLLNYCDRYTLAS